MTADMKKILVVEDERAMANALEVKLENDGFEVVVVNDGEEAMQKLQESSFNAVLLDLIMPKRDGWFVLEQLKQADNKVPVIVTTNLSQPEDEERAIKLGARKVFVKSNVTIKEISEFLSEIA